MRNLKSTPYQIVIVVNDRFSRRFLSAAVHQQQVLVSRQQVTTAISRRLRVRRRYLFVLFLMRTNTKQNRMKSCVRQTFFTYDRSFTDFISVSDSSPSQDIGRGVFSSTALIFLLLIVTPVKSILLTSRSHSEPTSSTPSSLVVSTIVVVVVAPLLPFGSSADKPKTDRTNKYKNNTSPAVFIDKRVSN